jgi:membrane-bound lytic murein transglycosylase D
MPISNPSSNRHVVRASAAIVASLWLLFLAGCASTGSGGNSARADARPSRYEANSHAARAAARRAALDRGEVLPIVDIWDRVRIGFAIDAPDDPQIDVELRWYLDHPLFLENSLQRSGRYLFHILNEIERRKLPTELALLPIVESGFQAHAVSRSNAVGLWQFLSETGKDYGLQQTAWVDQRRDVIESTRAALDYLSTLAQQFNGDWALALAAYNGGPGYITRMCEANRAAGRGDGFLDLPLRGETRCYVPKLMALKRLVDDPERYGLSLPDIPNAPYFTTVDVQGPIRLDLLGAIENLSPDDVRALNAGYTAGNTPPGGPHRVLVPVASAEQARRVLATMPRIAAPTPVTPPLPTGDLPQRRVQWQRYKVQPGDTLTGVARKYGVSIAALRQANGLHTGMLRKDQDLLIPVAYAADTRPGPARGCDGERVVHRVQPGETLWSIARRYQVDVARITTCNPALARGQIAAGQTVSVFRAAEATALADANRRDTYTVRQGDTPWRIAQNFGVSLEQLHRWNNGLKTRPLQPGDRLTVRGSGG